jgi:iron complex outermembrane receptor protein
MTRIVKITRHKVEQQHRWDDDSEASHTRTRLGIGIPGSCVGVLLLLCMITVSWADNPNANQGQQTDLTTLSLEQLMNIEVTSVAKKAQKVSDAAAAIFVITQEDIRRSGVTSIPDALRLAPGMQVARIDSNKWAISSRGFNGRFANKLLVLMDGRTVYTPAFSGVYWEVQDTLLDDVERIEIIRGPGATLWGANAVNGIINIITKKAWDTQGGLVTAGGGTEERGFGAMRYGARLGDDAFVRVYAKYFNRDGFVDPTGTDTDDDWDVVRGGFRLDWQASEHDTLTLQGDLYNGNASQMLTLPALTAPFSLTVNDDIDFLGVNLLSRWQHTFSSTSDMTVQLYYDRTDREEALFVEESRDTIDLDFQHRFTMGARQEIIWGFGYRYTHDDVTNTFFASITPDSRGNHLFSAFVQDDIILIQDRLRLTLGSKFEHNDYTGFEVQPNARLLWTPHTRHTVWAAVSRAVRTPSRGENDVRFNRLVIPPGTPMLNPGPLPALVALIGDDDFKSEVVLAYELGYRLRPLDRLSVDIAVFFNDYDNLRTVEPGAPFVETDPAPPHVVVPAIFDNKMHGESYGVELMVDWRPWDWWRMQVTYTYLQLDLDVDRDSLDTGAVEVEGHSPHHQFSFRSSLDLPWALEFDAWLRYVDDLPNLDVGSYVTLDLRLAWRPLKQLELSIVGQNLIASRHLEFVQESFPFPTEIERSVYGKITWRFGS